ncbi:acetylcholine receptor subunit beta 2 isoform X1 [Biomphalaria glabrata]|nr:acetylcholine receptor subunit beta 2 isoform X1 [Biomphalaria glabrata]
MVEWTICMSRHKTSGYPISSCTITNQGLFLYIKEWEDVNLRWQASEYGGIDEFLVPSEKIWIPDIVLFNNADGKYEVTLMTKATVYANGHVVWEPPAIYKSSCMINVEYFPFDEQK